MGTLRKILNPVRAACAATLFLFQPAFSQTPELDRLFEALQNADETSFSQIESQIWREWSRSGSAAMDLLLQRGRTALGAGNTDVAIAHFTALIDHAPDFAEGYNARATAHFQADRLGLSLSDIRQVLALNPRHFGAISGLAMILEELGEEEGALEAWRAVHALHPWRPGVTQAIERLQKSVEGQAL